MNPLRPQSRNATRSMNRRDSQDGNFGAGVQAAPSFSPGIKGNKKDEAYLDDRPKRAPVEKSHHEVLAKHGYKYDRATQVGHVYKHKYHHQVEALHYNDGKGHAETSVGGHQKSGYATHVKSDALDRHLTEMHGEPNKHSDDAGQGAMLGVGGKAPSGVHPKHHEVLRKHGYKHKGLRDGKYHDYEHSNGLTAVHMHKKGTTHFYGQDSAPRPHYHATDHARLAKDLKSANE